MIKPDPCSDCETRSIRCATCILRKKNEEDDANQLTASDLDATVRSMN